MKRLTFSFPWSCAQISLMQAEKSALHWVRNLAHRSWTSGSLKNANRVRLLFSQKISKNLGQMSLRCRYIGSLHSGISFRCFVIFEDSTIRKTANAVRSQLASSEGIWRSTRQLRARCAIGSSYAVPCGEFCNTVYFMNLRNCRISGFHNASFFIY